LAVFFHVCGPELPNYVPKGCPLIAIVANPSFEVMEMIWTNDLKSMSIDELWSLHQLVASFLSRKIVAEKERLDRQLHRLELGPQSPARRRYPRVFPKYRNPARPSETWAGRGKQPRWLTAQLESGKTLEDFRIRPS
jgi:DNA-binding protein H-NS